MIINLNTTNYIRVNNNYLYKVLNQEFVEDELSIVVKCEIDNYSDLVNHFQEITSIEFLESDEKTVTFYSIEYDKARYFTVTTEYEDTDGNIIPAIKLLLFKTQWESLVKKLNAQINPIINYDMMSVEEYAAVIKERMGKACTETIYAGVDVETSYGVEHFSATTHDQMNLKSLADSVKNTHLDVPYHNDKNQCKVYAYKEFINIYATVQSHIMYHRTYCNALNTLIQKLTTKDELNALVYGQEITDEEILEKMNVALEQGKLIVEAEMADYFKGMTEE